MYFGGNWTALNLMETLEDVTVNIASKQVYEFDTILSLTHHIHYLKGTLDTLNTEQLTIRDNYSYDHPNLKAEDDWQIFLNTICLEANTFMDLAKTFDDSILDTFLRKKIW